MTDYIPSLRQKIGHDPCMAIGVSALIVNEKQEILLEKRSDNGLYCFPGGSLDYEETILQGLRREVYEETGIALQEYRLLSITSGPSTTLHYPNGDVTNYVDFAFYCPLEGDIKIQPHDNESTAIAFVPLNAFPAEKDCSRGTYPALQKLLKKDFSLPIE